MKSNLTKRMTPFQVLPCEYSEIIQNSYAMDQLWTTISDGNQRLIQNPVKHLRWSFRENS